MSPSRRVYQSGHEEAEYVIELLEILTPHPANLFHLQYIFAFTVMPDFNNPFGSLMPIFTRNVLMSDLPLVTSLWVANSPSLPISMTSPANSLSGSDDAVTFAELPSRISPMVVSSISTLAQMFFKSWTV